MHANCPGSMHQVVSPPSHSACSAHGQQSCQRLCHSHSLAQITAVQRHIARCKPTATAPGHHLLPWQKGYSDGTPVVQRPRLLATPPAALVCGHYCHSLPASCCTATQSAASAATCHGGHFAPQLSACFHRSRAYAQQRARCNVAQAARTVAAAANRPADQSANNNRRRLALRKKRQLRKQSSSEELDEDRSEEGKELLEDLLAMQHPGQLDAAINMFDALPPEQQDALLREMQVQQISDMVAVYDQMPTEQKEAIRSSIEAPHNDPKHWAKTIYQPIMWHITKGMLPPEDAALLQKLFGEDWDGDMNVELDNEKVVAALDEMTEEQQARLPGILQRLAKISAAIGEVDKAKAEEARYMQRMQRAAASRRRRLARQQQQQQSEQSNSQDDADFDRQDAAAEHARQTQPVSASAASASSSYIGPSVNSNSGFASQSPSSNSSSSTTANSGSHGQAADGNSNSNSSSSSSSNPWSTSGSSKASSSSSSSSRHSPSSSSSAGTGSGSSSRGSSSGSSSDLGGMEASLKQLEQMLGSLPPETAQLLDRLSGSFQRYATGSGWEEEMALHESRDLRNLRRVYAELELLSRVTEETHQELGITPREFMKRMRELAQEINAIIVTQERIQDPVARSVVSFLQTQLISFNEQTGSAQLICEEGPVKRLGQFMRAAVNWSAYQAFLETFNARYPELSLAPAMAAAGMGKDNWWHKLPNALTAEEKAAGVPVVDESKVSAVAEMDADMLRFLTELELQGYSEEVFFKWYFHPVMGPRIRNGELLQGPQASHELLQQALAQLQSDDGLAGQVDQILGEGGRRTPFAAWAKRNRAPASRK